ncbi:MAG TPA: pyridoxal phosphate-dependent aminotransferase [Bacteroidota bacterium]|nr:pyridoxal phosphate-dependent aminotransferase [Bacteroidota bacterium]
MFSARLPGVLSDNPLTLEVARLRSDGATILDLAVSNPTDVGLCAGEEFREALFASAEARYTPAPRGLRSAREAIARYYAADGHVVNPEHIHCCSGTSEAYSFVFKLLCDPENSVLVPHPAYPLFEHLASLDGVRLRPYRLRRTPLGRWRIDFGSLDDACAERPRAVIVVNPSNPVGAYLDPEDLAHLRAFCLRRGIAMIVDEVFWDYPLATVGARARTVEDAEVLCFTLNGLSKLRGLPQLKLAWIMSSGPRALLEQALARLDIIADAYLSASTPVMLAGARLLDTGAPLHKAIHDRCAANLRALREMLAGHTSLQLQEPCGGWSAVIDLPRDTDEERWVIRLLKEQGVYVHPGYFFDFPRGSHVVLSLLPDEALFREGVQRMLALS